MSLSGGLSGGASGLSAIARRVSQPTGNILNFSNQSELDAAIAAAVPGDSIVGATKTYNNLDINNTSGSVRDGTAGNLIEIRGATTLGINLTGSNTRIRMNKNFWRLRDLVFSGFTNSLNNWFTLNGCQDCVVEFVKWDGISVPSNTSGELFRWKSGAVRNTLQFFEITGTTPGVCLRTWGDDGSQDTDNKIRWGYIHDIGGGQETIQAGIGGGASNDMQMRQITEHCLWQDLTGNRSENISCKSQENTYRYLTWRDCNDTLQKRGGRNCTFHNLFVLGTSDGIILKDIGHKLWNYFQAGGNASTHGGLRLPGGDIAGDHIAPDNADLKNITIYDLNTDYCLVLHWNKGTFPTAPTGITLKNIYIDTAQADALQERTAGVATGQTNLVRVRGAASILDADSDLGFTTTTQDLTADGEVQRLAVGNTDAIDSGTIDADAVDDFDGDVRTLIDIGADEFVSGAVRRIAPLLSSDFTTNINETPVITSISPNALSDGQLGVSVVGAGFGRFPLVDGDISINSKADGSGINVKQTITAWSGSSATFDVIAGGLSGLNFVVIKNMWGFSTIGSSVNIT